MKTKTEQVPTLEESVVTIDKQLDILNDSLCNFLDSLRTLFSALGGEKEKGEQNEN